MTSLVNSLSPSANQILSGILNQSDRWIEYVHKLNKDWFFVSHVSILVLVVLSTDEKRECGDVGSIELDHVVFQVRAYLYQIQRWCAYSE